MPGSLFPDAAGPHLRRSSRGSLIAAFAAILALASALRLWGIDYGIPHPVARPDEETVIRSAIQMFARRDADPRFFEYPSLSIYATVLSFEAFYRTGKLTGGYQRPLDFLFDDAVLRPGLAYRIARASSLLFALATVAATGVLGWELSRRRTAAALAALLLAASFLHVAFSRFATVDVAMTFFTTAALAFSLRAARSQRLFDYLAAGAAIGLAASAKYNAALVSVALFAAAVHGVRGDRQARRSALRLLAAALVSLAAYAATSPYTLVHFQEVRAGFEKHSYFFTHGPDPLGLWVHLGTTFPAGLGWPLYAAALLAILRALHRRRPQDVVLLSFLFVFFATIASVRVVYPRYVLPLLPPALALAAEACDSLLRRRWALAGTAGLLVAPGLLSSIRFDRLATRADTRLLAAEWVNANVPRRERILVCRGYGAPSINSDRRRPPAFEPVLSACRPEDLTEDGARFVLTHEHPTLTKYSSLDPETRRWLEASAERRARFDPFVPRSSEEPLFYYSDAFYLPLAGFGAVSRGGPIVTVWELPERDAADGNPGIGSPRAARPIDVNGIVPSMEARGRDLEADPRAGVGQ